MHILASYAAAIIRKGPDVDQKKAGHIGRHKRAVYLAPIFVLLDVICELSMPLFMSKIVDVGIANQDVAYIARIGVIMILLAVAAMGFGIMMMRLSTVASMGFGANLRDALFAKVQPFSFTNIDQFSTASLVTRLTNDVNNLQLTLMMMLRILLRAPMMLVIAFFLAYNINHELSVVLAVAIPLLMIGVTLILRTATRRFAIVQERIDGINNRLQENFIGQRVVKAFVRSDFEIDKFQKSNDALTNAFIRAVGIVILNMPVMMLVMNGATLAILWMGGHMVAAGTLGAGQLIGFLSYVTQILMSVMMISMVFIMTARAQASALRVVEVLDTQVDIVDKVTPALAAQAESGVRGQESGGRGQGAGGRSRGPGGGRCCTDVPTHASTVGHGGAGRVPGRRVQIQLRRRRRRGVVRDQLHRRTGRGGGDRRRHGLRQIHAGPLDPPALRRLGRRGPGGRRRRAGLRARHAAGRHRVRAAEKHALLRHHPRQPAVGPGGCDAGQDRSRVPGCPGPRFHHVIPGWLRHRTGPGRGERVGRAEAAAVHRPRHPQRPQYAVSAMVGGLLAVAGRFNIGSLAAYLQYSRQVGMPVQQISNQFNTVLAALAGAERVFEVMDQTPEVDEGCIELVGATLGADGAIVPSRNGARPTHWAWHCPDPAGAQAYTELRGDVRFHDVTFGYVPDKTVLRNISLYAKPGQKIAFVGSTGAGKTTITNLINRFYEIQQGSITFDGIDIRQIRKDNLRGSIGMVLQDTHLFDGSVMENIRYGRLDATDAECVQAARRANAHSFIKRLPEGYQTLITADGANLSQGQRQLLAIARAAVADPPVMILDEATSSIDTRTERLIEKGLDELMRDRTVFVIAHRLSTVRNANAIIVIENGEIIERGDHDGLLAQRGRYWQLYTGQFELT